MSSARLVSLFRFGLVGTLGFLVDAGVVLIFAKFLNIDPIFSRIPAWLTAVSTTYIFNVNFTFSEKNSKLEKNRKRPKRYILYILSQLSGGAINILVFSLLVSFVGSSWFVSLVVGTLFGLMINFYGASIVIKNKF